MGCQSIAGLPKFAGTHLYTWVERGTVRVKCLAQEHNTMFPARAQTRTARSGDERTNHEVPPTLYMYMHVNSRCFFFTLPCNKHQTCLFYKLNILSSTSHSQESYLHINVYLKLCQSVSSGIQEPWSTTCQEMSVFLVAIRYCTSIQCTCSQIIKYEIAKLVSLPFLH